MSIRVLHIFGDLCSLGGAERWVLDMFRLCDSRVCFDFLVSVDSGVILDEVRGLGSCVYYVPFSRSCFPLSCLNSYLSGVRKILRRGCYDVVHVHQFDLSGEILRVAFEEGVPKRVISFHASCYTNDRIHRWLSYNFFGRRWIFRYATDILPVSGLVSAALCCDGNSKTKIIYPAINLECFKISDIGRVELRKKYEGIFGIPSGAIVLGHVGRFAYQKNHRFLLRLLLSLSYQDERIYGLFIGGGELFDQIYRESVIMGLSRRIIFTGRRDDVVGIICSLFDVFVLPSLYEGLPIVMIESLAAGLGVIYSDKITTELDQFFPNRTFREKLKVENWAAAIPKALNAKIKSKDAITELQKSPFTIQTSLEKLIEVYEK
ncbi:MAG: glycosyltransferase [Planctomycetaceae bacterium]|jgi:glycosyltransferase involved in cell wall biosynthesis|nr:glycosyltransferase [Planctomycetaceae bacterium]